MEWTMNSSQKCESIDSVPGSKLLLSTFRNVCATENWYALMGSCKTFNYKQLMTRSVRRQFFFFRKFLSFSSALSGRFRSSWTAQGSTSTLPGTYYEPLTISLWRSRDKSEKNIIQIISSVAAHVNSAAVFSTSLRRARVGGRDKMPIRSHKNSCSYSVLKECLSFTIYECMIDIRPDFAWVGFRIICGRQQLANDENENTNRKCVNISFCSCRMDFRRGENDSFSSVRHRMAYRLKMTQHVTCF